MKEEDAGSFVAEVKGVCLIQAKSSEKQSQ